MKPVKRRLGEPIPVRLILTPQGTLEMVDGSDVSAYLKRVRRMWKVQGRVEVSITERDAAQRLEMEALLHRYHSA